MIFIKALDSGSPSTSTDGVVKFSMDPGEYRVSISGKYIVTQYLNETNNTFHIMR